MRPFFFYTACLLLTAQMQAQCWKQVAAAQDFTIAIKNDGTLWAWGINAGGQLGVDLFEDQFSPVQVDTATDWVQISVGFTSAGIKSNGTLWTWGGTDHYEPTPFDTASNWQQVTNGIQHVMAIKTDGTLWGWGSNYYGQLGDGTSTDRPTPVQVGTDHDWQQVSCAWNYNLAIKTDGTLWGWGKNTDWELGDGTTINRLTPVQIGSDSDWQQVKADFSLGCTGLKKDGTLWQWGSSFYPIPTQYGTAADWQKIISGYDGGCVLKNDGTLWRLDYPVFGAPIDISTDWQDGTDAYGRIEMIKTDGSLWAWGQNNNGQLGDGTNMYSITHIPIACPLSTTGTESPPGPIENLGLYPNPAQDYLVLQTTVTDDMQRQFEIKNLLGETVINRQNLPDNREIGLSALPPGIYILVLSNREGQMAKPFVKM